LSFLIVLTFNRLTLHQVAIVLKVWRTHRQALSSSARSLFPVIAVIIESGAIYTASVLGFVITFLLKSNGQYPALGLITPLVVSFALSPD
jgi:hypothetical protein